jgi:hypothetical protein
LLDPRETHGQQALFLKLFAKRLNRRIGRSVANISAAREAVTYSISKYRRRIDVLVTTPTLVIALENKVDAEEQDEQLSDYYEHLRRICKKDYCLVFLTPDGRSPERMPDKTTKRLRDLGRLFLLSYCRDIDEWLMDCHRSCQAENVQSFIANMRDYIEGRMQTDRR